MGRPNRLTDNQPSPLDWTKDVLYGTAGELTQMKTYHGFNVAWGFNEWTTETRTYNARLQLTQLSRSADFSGSLGTIDYVYAAANNGRISQMIASGETVNYTYDSLNRLIAAATPGNGPADWGLSFSNDGFGNRLSQAVTKGSAPAQSVTVDSATNRVNVNELSYDANGNPTTLNGVAMAYDVDNRLMTYGSIFDEQYAYGPDNQRVWKKRTDGSEEVYFTSMSGQRLGIYQVYALLPTQLQFWQKETRIYFGGRPVATRDVNDTTTPAYPDRLGSIGSYFPYGEERTATASDKDKFATYYRDGTTGLDYAMNRYYSPQYGRFVTPDPYQASGAAANPGSWNRYGYVSGDPVNKNDPTGLDEFFAGLYPMSDPGPGGFMGRPFGGWAVSVGGGAWGACYGHPEYGWVCPPGLPFNQQSGGTGGPVGQVIESEEVAAGKPVGYNNARLWLSEGKCAKFFGFSSGSDAVKALDQTVFKSIDLGTIQVQDVGDGRAMTLTSPPIAQTTGANIIQINSSFNWFFPNDVRTYNVTAGVYQSFPFLDAFNAEVQRTVGAWQFSALVILHEFRHVRGAAQETDRVRFNQDIIDNCVKY